MTDHNALADACERCGITVRLKCKACAGLGYREVRSFWRSSDIPDCSNCRGQGLLERPSAELLAELEGWLISSGWIQTICRSNAGCSVDWNMPFDEAGAGGDTEQEAREKAAVEAAHKVEDETNGKA